LRAVLSDAALVAVAAERPLSHASICYTIAAADAVSQASSESFLLAGMPGLPSPSPVLHKHISSLSGILSEFTEESVQSSSIINTYRSAFRKNIFGYQIRSSVLSMLGWANESGSRNEGHREDGSSIQKKGEWERKIIPKRWRLGNAQWARLQFVRKFSCKAPVYHNCRIFAGDGRLLCYCDRKKLEWLVSLLLLYPSRPQWFSILLYLLLLPAFKVTTQINCCHVP
jgi:cation-transporting P-type ATPase D